ncbi:MULTISPECIES: MBL fold metallo-hydrolase [unclassified Enterococcus]|uniref:MBL fold metallo-hydrolase n=1 Tax=unclassified Enterococcus TaxID=2608891 RepID=UPI00155602E0|nr:MULTISPECIES: MBL fold metallo-hydrolase [unclassified Enterococcus]MBS7577168.1 MBL fold metallo-hydrolase [Enterococcus sp. MMGLQ5-2]MBS7584739.1 MBL fold metallo-hydrolase [Enterococcus sp. MMGLQ5-1]NPD12594.1 MBL fold metallo-hydrolase [Enterococcus sp. MMGLQ5-1]NPD37002.1 MBL fold metallo-hydrolase [Enterococcus sp. MMGLQ5-2]
MLSVQKLTNRVANENTYFIYNDKFLLIVDPGSETEQILATIDTINLPIAAIILTHTHYDHIMSVEAIRAKYIDVPVYVSPKEAEWLYTPELNLSGLDRHNDMSDVIVQPAEFEFVDYENYSLGEMSFKVLPTPGHSAGGISFLFDEFVITGDALFKGTIGRTDLFTGNQEQLINGIKTELLTLPETLTVLPGHGQPTTIREEKWFNPFFKD